MLEIKNLSVQVAGATVVSSVSINIKEGAVTVLQGANGSGKSSIVNALIGHSSYSVVDGDIVLDGLSIKGLSMHERARLGILVIMQQQVVIPGLLVVDYFFQLYSTLYPSELVLPIEFRQKLESAFDFVGLDRSLIDASVCDGFSGGQKKRFELVHVLILNPRYVILDEVDSGLDTVGIEKIPVLVALVMKRTRSVGWLFISHNKFLVDQLKPDQIFTLERSVS